MIESGATLFFDRLSRQWDTREFKYVPPESYWRSLVYFNVYRLVVGLTLGILTWYSSGRVVTGAQYQELFYFACLGSALTALLALVAHSWRQPAFFDSVRKGLQRA